ncbi:mRNA cleavage and polyadenylation factor subunit [Coemansia sp. RSA 1853]|nr:mRNA cleavage and polyadenylation factor subunit [Coemansia sp. RSA 1853]
MRDPVYTYCREILPPSVVEHAASLSFTRPGACNLALARGNLLEVYEVGLVMKKSGDDEVPSAEYEYRDAGAEEFDLPMIREDQTAPGQRSKNTKQPQLHLIGRWSLHGKIMDLRAVQRGKARGGVDRLLLSFAEAKMSLVAFDADTQGIATESIHYYEHDALKQRTFNDGQTCDLRTDPEGRCAALRLYDDQLAVLPFAAPGDLTATKPYADSFVVNLRDAGIGVRNVRDFAFLSGYLEPTLALLHEQETTWPGRAEEAVDTCSVTIVSLDLGRNSVSVLNAASKLPYDCRTLLPVPEPVGGVMVFASSSITHVANGAISCISLLNHAAKQGIGASMQNYLDETNVDLELVLDPSGSVCTLVGSNTVVLWTQYGHVFLLRLAGNGRLIKRIVAKQIAGTDIRKNPHALTAPLWDDISILPSCATELHLVYDDDSAYLSDEQLFFIGGRSGRSLLVGVRDANTLDRAAGDSDNIVDDIDIEAELYGDAPPSSTTIKSSEREEWSASYTTTVYDEIVGTGTVVGMDIGVSAASGAAENLEMVSCMGNEWRGSLCIQQRHVQPEIVASFDLPGSPVRGVWTVRCLREYNIGGVIQAADLASLADLSDTFMVVSRDTSTSVFAAGDDLQELDRTGFYANGPTIDVGEILGYTRVVQVHTHGLRVVNASGREVQSIGFDQDQHAVFAEIADPYVLVRMRSGKAVVFEASSDSGRLREAAVPSYFEGGQVVAASLFEDVHHVLGTNREWAERNKDTLNDQARASGEALLDGDFDNLYADAAVAKKRKRGVDHVASQRQLRRKHSDDVFDDLYDEGDNDQADEEMEDAKDEGARPEDVRGDSPMFMLVLTDSGDLNILRLPQFERVWTTRRLDNLLDTLTVAQVAGAKLAASDSDSDEEGAAHSHVASATHGRRVDQIRLVQLGGDSITDTHLLVLTTAGEVAVYRAFEHCAHEYMSQRAAATTSRSDLELQLDNDDGLALRFARMQHDVLAYDPEYQQKMRRVQARQEKAFAEWEERSKMQLVSKVEEERTARKRAVEKQQREETMAVADWDEGSDDEVGASDSAVVSKVVEENVETSFAAPDDIYADDSSPSKPTQNISEQPIMPSDNKAVEDSDIDEAEAALRYPLDLTRKFIVLDNLGGYPAVFVTGLRAVVVLAGSKRFARVHPVRVPVKLPPSLQPVEAKGFDAEASGLLMPGRPLVGVARFHSRACANGIVVLTQSGTLVVARLPLSAQTARGGIEFDSAWPVRCIPAGTAHGGISTQGGVAFHAGSGSYVAATATPEPFYIREPNPDIAFRQATEAAEAAGKPAPAPRTVIPEYQRHDLRTTSVPPLVPRFSIDLLSPETWETVDSYALDAHEHVAAMRTLELESAQAEGGSRALLCVGTGFVLGEDVMSRGRVYVFDIVDVVPLPGRPQTNRKLKLLYTEEVHGVVSAVGELRGNLVMSEGSKLYVRSFANDTLTSFAFLDCHTWVRTAVGLRNFLLVGDVASGLSFVGFQEEGPARLHVLGRDAHACLPVECADFLVLGQQLQLLAADAHGHLHLFVYAPRDVHSFGGQRLLRRGEFSLRSRVVSLRRVVGSTRHVCLAATADGAVHAVSMVPEKTYKRLQRVNAQLVRAVPPVCGLNPREYRAVPLHRRQNQAPRRTVLDADLLVPLYAHGSVARQREAAQRDGTTADRVLRDIVETESAFGIF